MKNIAIVSDSSVSLTEKQIKDLGVYIAPLSIIYDNEEYLDQVNITQEKVTQLLNDGVLLGTSQPNLGVIIKLLEKVKAKNYDHVFILSISSALSGTLSSFQSGIEDVGLENYSLIDTMTLCGPVQESVKVILKMNQEGKKPNEIEDYLNNEFFKNTATYVYPQTLEQLKRSGRISKGAGLLASVLRVKPILKLNNHGETIEKFKTTRTEQKVLGELVKDLKHNKVNPEDHVIYLAHLEREDILEELQGKFTEEIGDFEYFVANLPAAIATHAGVGTIAIQWAKKA